MKLRNKLIPLLSVVASTTVVAPMVTCCSNSSMEMVDITKNYIPTIAKAEKHDGMTDTEAQDLYFSHVAENPDIIKQDILKYEADRLPERISNMEYEGSTTQQYFATSVKAEVGVSDVSARKVTATIEGEEQFFYALSAKIKYVTQFKLLNAEGNTEEIYDQTFSMTLKDLPTQVYTKSVTKDYANVNRWYISNVLVDTATKTPSKYLSYVPGWSYSFEETHQQTINQRTTSGEVITTTTGSNDSGTFSRLDQITNLIEAMEDETDFSNKYLFYESYHLSDVGFTKGPSALMINRDADGYVTGTYSKSCTKGGLAISDIELMGLSKSVKESISKSNDIMLYIGSTTMVEYDNKEQFTSRQVKSPASSTNVYSNVRAKQFGLGFDGSDDGGTWANEDRLSNNLRMTAYSTSFDTRVPSLNIFEFTDNNTVKINNPTILNPPYAYALYLDNEEYNSYIGRGADSIRYTGENYPTLEFTLWDTTVPHYIGYAYIDKDSGELVQDYLTVTDPVKVRLTPAK